MKKKMTDKNILKHLNHKLAAKRTVPDITLSPLKTLFPIPLLKHPNPGLFFFAADINKNTDDPSLFLKKRRYVPGAHAVALIHKLNQLRPDCICRGANE